MQKTLSQVVKELRPNHQSFRDNASGAFSEAGKNSIFHQKSVVSLNAVAFEQLAIAELKLQEAALALMAAEDALVGFDEISKRELGLASNFTHGYIYMLREFIYQSKVLRENEAAQKVRTA